MAPATLTAEQVRDEVRAWILGQLGPGPDRRGVVGAAHRVGLRRADVPGGRRSAAGYNRALANVVNEELAKAGAVGPPAGLGYLLAAPTIATHATDEQKKHWLQRILDGTDAWCQLFSEPGAGSDLAGLQCKAERDGDEWVITGQKVWTSTAQMCNMGMLIARTDPEAPKHTGISYFGIRHGPARHRDPAPQEMTGSGDVQRGVPRRRPRSRRRHDRRPEQRVGGREHHARRRAGRARKWRERRGRLGLPGADREPARPARRRHRRPDPHRRHRRRWRWDVEAHHRARPRRTGRSPTRSCGRGSPSSTRSSRSASTRRCACAVAERARGTEPRQADDERHAPPQPRHRHPRPRTADGHHGQGQR